VFDTAAHFYPRAILVGEVVGAYPIPFKEMASKNCLFGSWRHNVQRNDTQRNDMQHNGT